MNVESFEIDGWEQTQTGLVIAEDEQWLLVKHIPVDYVIDGFKLYKKRYILNRVTGQEEQLKGRVLKLKNEPVDIPTEFVFSDAIGCLRWCQQRYGLFEFQDNSETELFYGRINRVSDSTLIIDSIHSDGTLEEEFNYEFNLDEIRTIAFESDYFISIRLLWMDEQRSKPTP